MWNKQMHTEDPVVEICLLFYSLPYPAALHASDVTIAQNIYNIKSSLIWNIEVWEGMLWYLSSLSV